MRRRGSLSLIVDNLVCGTGSLVWENGGCDWCKSQNLLEFFFFFADGQASPSHVDDPDADG